MSKQSHYPDYDVMKEKDAWDDHTQSIVSVRIIREKPYSFLTPTEAEILRSICTLLVDDARGDVIQYVLGHFDQAMMESYGESERKAGVPRAQTLLREGLKSLNQASITRYTKSFIGLDINEQENMLQELSESNAQPASLWKHLNQRALFKKLLTLTLEAYYSHPVVWSEIGYGGPAYPRGYVRAQLGQLDPWEAVRKV